MLVNDIFKLPKIGAFKLSKFLISNWSKGLAIIIELYVVLFIVWIYCSEFSLILIKIKN
jgi:hypothetical protein